MFSKVHSIGILGVEGYPVVVEADVSEGLPGFTMVGISQKQSERRRTESALHLRIPVSGFRQEKLRSICRRQM